MGYLFENLEKMDIQAERRNTALARAEAEAAKEEAKAAKEEAEAAKEEAKAAKEEAKVAKEETRVAKEEAERKLISLVERKLTKGQTEEQIAEDLLEPVEYIRKLREKSDNMSIVM